MKRWRTEGRKWRDEEEKGTKKCRTKGRKGRKEGRKAGRKK